MPFNNDILFNAAMTGFVAGAQMARNINDPTAAHYVNLVAQGVQFATEVDSLIANDGTISGGAGVTLPPTTAAIQDAQLSKTQLMVAICMSVRAGQFQAPATPVVASGFAVSAAAVVGLYTEVVASQSLG